MMKKLCFTTLFLFIGLLCSSAYAGWWGGQDASKQIPAPWPPVIGKPYPDLELISQYGDKFHLSELKGKTLLIEPVGMNCAACQAFSGAETLGAYENNSVQKGLGSIETLVKQYSGGIKLPNENVLMIQILFYDMKLGTPKPEDAKKWADHFGFNISRNQIVAVPVDDLRGGAAYNLIPGFQVVDKNFILRSDSTGYRPHDDLYRTTLPMLGKLAVQ